MANHPFQRAEINCTRSPPIDRRRNTGFAQGKPGAESSVVTCRGVYSVRTGRAISPVVKGLLNRQCRSRLAEPPVPTHLTPKSCLTESPLCRVRQRARVRQQRWPVVPPILRRQTWPTQERVMRDRCAPRRSRPGASEPPGSSSTAPRPPDAQRSGAADLCPPTPAHARRARASPRRPTP